MTSSLDIALGLLRSDVSPEVRANANRVVTAHLDLKLFNPPPAPLGMGRFVSAVRQARLYEPYNAAFRHAVEQLNQSLKDTE